MCGAEIVLHRDVLPGSPVGWRKLTRLNFNVSGARVSTSSKMVASFEGLTMSAVRTLRPNLQRRVMN